jgi:hypothetical protein
MLFLRDLSLHSIIAGISSNWRKPERGWGGVRGELVMPWKNWFLWGSFPFLRGMDFDFEGGNR